MTILRLYYYYTYYDYTATILRQYCTTCSACVRPSTTTSTNTSMLLTRSTCKQTSPVTLPFALPAHLHVHFTSHLPSHLPSQIERRCLALVRSGQDSHKDLELYNERAHGYLPKSAQGQPDRDMILDM